ncbi:septum formation family protein [Jatrophihabitans fulvus]
MTAATVIPPPARGRRALAAALASIALTATLAACTGDDDNTVSVFAVKAGECFTVPKSVKVQLSTLSRVGCDKPHSLEAYATPVYRPAGSVSSQRPSTPKVPTGVPTAVPTALPSIAQPSAPSASVAGLDYPGASVLKKFADGACAQAYGPYVGVDYLESDFFYTYLLPSARSWEQSGDRKVICFVTTTGGTLKSSVKGSKR